MNVLRLASFSEDGIGGNPAGVCILNELPSISDMQACAKEVGFSETSFACPVGQKWRVRYFSPENEVPFCGHATIALGVALAMKKGDGLFSLQLNDAAITVEGHSIGDQFQAALQSPPTKNKEPEDSVLQSALDLFGFSKDDLNPQLPPQLIFAGADHLAITLANRDKLASMKYDLNKGKTLMLREGWTTIMLAYSETAQLFHSRNPLASGGVYEDPATGAATAAYAGYLNDINWPHNGRVEFIQGEDMGAKSKLIAEVSTQKGASIKISGQVRKL